MSRAALPLDTAIPYLRLTRLENFFSNSSTKGPSDEIQPESRASKTYFFSKGLNSGLLTGMKSMD
jgi:hypothetical protein